MTPLLITNIPKDVFLMLLEKLDVRSIGRLANTSSGIRALVGKDLWKAVVLNLDNRRHIDYDNLERVCANLRVFTQKITLSVSEYGDSQRIFRAVIEAVQSRPVIDLQLKHCRLDARSLQTLTDAINHSSGKWTSSLKEIQLPLQLKNNMKKSPREPLSSTIRIATTVQVTKDGESTSHSIQIRAWGEHYKTFPVSQANGTPVELLEDLLKGVGFPNGFDVVELKGNQSCDADLGNTMATLDINAEPVKIRDLSLIGFDFDSPWPDFDHVDFSSILRLQIRDCINLPFLFKRFMERPSAISLESFSCHMWHAEESMWYSNANNIEAFLLSFRTLKHLGIHVRSSWSLDWKRITEKHSTLESLEYSTIENDLPRSLIDDVARNIPHLKRLAFRMPVIEDLVAKGSLTKAQMQTVRGVLRKLETNWDLEELMVIFSPGAADGKSRCSVQNNLENAAHTIYEMLTSDRVKRVGLWMRRSRYRLGHELKSGVPPPQIFHYRK